MASPIQELEALHRAVVAPMPKEECEVLYGRAGGCTVRTSSFMRPCVLSMDVHNDVQKP